MRLGLLPCASHWHADPSSRLIRSMQVPVFVFCLKDFTTVCCATSRSTQSQVATRLICVQALQQLVTGLDAEQQATLQAALQGQPAKS